MSRTERGRLRLRMAGEHFSPGPVSPTGWTVTLPAIIDVRDDLHRALEATDDEESEALAAEIETVLDRLDAFENRDLAEREGVVDEIDNQLLRVEEQLADDEAARAIGSARNRLHIYRGTREATDANLAVVESSVRERDDRDRADRDHDRHRDSESAREVERVLPVGEETITVSLTVANTGEDTEVVPTVRLYDDGDELEAIRGPEFSLAGGTQETFEFDVEVPADAESYGISVADTGGVRDQRRG